MGAWSDHVLFPMDVCSTACSVKKEGGSGAPYDVKSRVDGAMVAIITH